MHRNNNNNMGNNMNRNNVNGMNHHNNNRNMYGNPNVHGNPNMHNNNNNNMNMQGRNNNNMNPHRNNNMGMNANGHNNMHHRNQAQMHIPQDFLCPISNQIMDEPVMAADGRIYDRMSMENWLKRSNSSPIFGTPLKHKMLMPYNELKGRINFWKMQQNMR